MALSEKDKTEIVEIIKISIEASLSTIVKTIQPDECRLKECNHLFDRIKTLGEGNTEKGIESLSKTMSMMTRIRHFSEKATGKVALTAILFVAAGIGTFLVKLIGVVIKGF